MILGQNIGLKIILNFQLCEIHLMSRCLFIITYGTRNINGKFCGEKNKEFARLNFKEWVTHQYFKTPTLHSISVAKDGGHNPTFLSFFFNKI